MTPKEAVKEILNAFEAGLFTRSIARDHESGDGRQEAKGRRHDESAILLGRFGHAADLLGAPPPVKPAIERFLSEYRPRRNGPVEPDFFREAV